jgi:molecular chaperone GrpE
VTERKPEEHPEHEENPTPIIRDKRRLDPETGAVREPTAPAGDGVDGSSPEARDAAGTTDAGGLEATLAERTADLQRLQADYANYRRRVERDREAVREMALANILTNLLPVLDDIGRAREHGELEGGFKSVADALEAAVGKLGLERFGEPGEPFDPSVHEALTHAHSAEVTEPTAVQVFQPGYRIGARVVRPARVGVAEPEPADEN